MTYIWENWERVWKRGPLAACRPSEVCNDILASDASKKFYQ